MTQPVRKGPSLRRVLSPALLLVFIWWLRMCIIFCLCRVSPLTSFGTPPLGVFRGLFKAFKNTTLSLRSGRGPLAPLLTVPPPLEWSAGPSKVTIWSPCVPTTICTHLEMLRQALRTSDSLLCLTANWAAAQSSGYGVHFKSTDLPRVSESVGPEWSWGTCIITMFPGWDAGRAENCCSRD